MSQERVSALSILSIENERARSLNLKDIVKQFAERKAGRRRLFINEMSELCLKTLYDYNGDNIFNLILGVFLIV